MARITLKPTTNKLSLVTLSNLGTIGGGGSGFIYFEDVVVSGGTASNKIYQDPPNNTILEVVTVSSLTFDVFVRSSFPIVKINGIQSTLIRSPDGEYVGSATVNITGAGSVEAIAVNPMGINASNASIYVNVELPPSITSLSFTGDYPVTQTELKENDSFSLSIVSNKIFDQVEILAFGAAKSSIISVTPGTIATVSISAANQGNTPQLLAARARVRDVLTSAWSLTRDTNADSGVVEKLNLVKLNNLHPSIVLGSIVYPPSQGALKNSESATVGNTISDFNTVLYDSPNGELTIANPSIPQDPKTCTRLSGTYNVSTSNFRITATRNANGSITSQLAVVNIANSAASVSISTPAARLRSGGNNGTVAQDHTITIISDQQLLNAPSVTAPAGTFQGVWVGGPDVWTRVLRVNDNDSKGVFSFSSLVATNLAGLITNVITGSSNYTLGGFVQRSLTFSPFSQNTTLNVNVVDYSKLKANIFTATNQSAIKMTTQGDVSNSSNHFTVLTLGTNPTTLFWNDQTAAATNSSGTAQITNVEEVV
jgi:hypothetical protein